MFNLDFFHRSSLMGTTLRAAPSKSYVNAFSTNDHACIAMPTWHRCAPPILFWHWPPFNLFPSSCITLIFFVDSHWWVPLHVQYPTIYMPFRQIIMYILQCPHDIHVLVHLFCFDLHKFLLCEHVQQHAPPQIAGAGHPSSDRSLLLYAFFSFHISPWFQHFTSWCHPPPPPPPHCTCTVQITFIFIGQTRLVFGNRVCTCFTKHSNAFRTFLNWLKNSKLVWHEPKLHISRLPLFANFDLWSVSVWWVPRRKKKWAFNLL